MKIGLIDVDGHNWPNLCLMKLSACHKAHGDDVEWWTPEGRYDRVYKSRVFTDTYSKDTITVENADEVIKGGTGYGPGPDLPDEVEHTHPDYALYPQFSGTAYGFMIRGCPRNCGFCIVSKKEGRRSTHVADLSEFWDVMLSGPYIGGAGRLIFMGRSNTMSRTYLRGDLYYADLGHGIGSEQKGTRPVVIIQNNVGNKYSPTVIIAAITSKANIKAKLPTHYYLDAGNGLTQPSLVLLEQIRTVDKQRLSSYIGRLDKKHIQGINHALAVSIGLIEPVPPKLTLCLCGACADAFRGTGAFALRDAAPEQAEKEVCAYCKERAGTLYDVQPRLERRNV